jgi:enoyl-CoA hydratase/carnithine racemase
VQACLHALGQIVRSEEATGWSATKQAQDTNNRTQDVLEGVHAFFEKRAPQWAGR